MGFNKITDQKISSRFAAWERVVRLDSRLRSAHISLLSAMILLWLRDPAAEEFIVSRKELMLLSKVGSIATYHKCIYELVQFGYIYYRPTYNAYIGTRVQFNLPRVEDQANTGISV